MTPTHTNELRELLNRASTVAAEEELDLDAFMRAAWQSYVDARPGLRQQLEEMHLMAQIDELRKAGGVGLA